ncbi:hypothetical protein RYX36_013300 [Vicia faba]
MMKLFTLVIISSLLLKQATLILADVGTAASYGPPYIPTSCDGSRREQFPPGNIFVAVNEGLWDNGAACGRRYRVRCVSGINKPCKGGYDDIGNSTERPLLKCCRNYLQIKQSNV